MHIVQFSTIFFSQSDYEKNGIRIDKTTKMCYTKTKDKPNFERNESRGLVRLRINKTTNRE
jgi:hypothetical protein